MFIWTTEAEVLNKLKGIGYQIEDVPTDIKCGVPFHLVVDNVKSHRDNIIHKFKYLSEDDVIKIGETFNTPPYQNMRDYLIQNPTDDILREFNELYQVFNTYRCHDFLHYSPDATDVKHTITIKDDDNDTLLKNVNPALYEEVNEKIVLMTDMTRLGIISKNTVIEVSGLSCTLGEYNQAAYSYSYIGIAGLRFIRDIRIEIGFENDIRIIGNRNDYSDETYLLGQRIQSLVYRSEIKETDFDERYNITSYLAGELDNENLDEEQVLKIINSGYKIEHTYSIEEQQKIVDFLCNNTLYTIPFIRMLTLKNCMIRSANVPKMNELINVSSIDMNPFKVCESNFISEQRKLRNYDYVCGEEL